MIIWFILPVFLGLFGLVLILWPDVGHRMDVSTAELRGMRTDAFTSTPSDTRRLGIRFLGVIAILFAVGFLFLAFQQQKEADLTTQVFTEVLDSY